MKLTTRYNAAILPALLIVLIVSAVVYSFAVNYFLTKQLDRDLNLEVLEIQNHVAAFGELPAPSEYRNLKVEFKKLSVHARSPRFLDTVYWNAVEREQEPGRTLIAPIREKGVSTMAVITKSKVEKEDLIEMILPITIGIVCFAGLTLWGVSSLLLRRLWEPFFTTLNYLKCFKVSKGESPPGIDTQIDEFRALNESVTAMSAQTWSEYKGLKAFTENAAHELMTPIAIIKGKLDTLIQGEGFKDHQAIVVADLYEAVSRLSRLNQSLLLLVKIENNIFHEKRALNFRKQVEEKVTLFKELFLGKSLTLETELSLVEVSGSVYLIDLLINNLLTNAIRHSEPEGAIEIILSRHYLEIRNPSADGKRLPERIFQRFFKDSGSDGTGLGLAISKEICEAHGWTLHYSFVDMKHSFKVVFGNMSDSLAI